MRDLYSCNHSRYPDGIVHKFVWCRCNHILGRGMIRPEKVDNSETLVYAICQNCKDFLSENEDVPT
jgi:hypothetical protein